MALQVYNKGWYYTAYFHQGNGDYDESLGYEAWYNRIVQLLASRYSCSLAKAAWQLVASRDDLLLDWSGDESQSRHVDPQLAMKYLWTLWNGSVFCMVFRFQGAWRERPGLFIVMSSGASTNQQRPDAGEVASPVSPPDKVFWQYFRVRFLVGGILGQHVDIDKTEDLGYVSDWAAFAGGPHWEAQFGVLEPGMWELDGLRRLIRCIASVHIEEVYGLSRFEYLGLDVYSVTVGNLEHCPCPSTRVWAWSILNLGTSVQRRKYVSPTYFWQCSPTVCFPRGTRSGCFERLCQAPLEAVVKLETAVRAVFGIPPAFLGHPGVETRLRVLEVHVFGDVPAPGSAGPRLALEDAGDRPAPVHVESSEDLRAALDFVCEQLLGMVAEVNQYAMHEGEASIRYLENRPDHRERLMRELSTLQLHVSVWLRARSYADFEEAVVERLGGCGDDLDLGLAVYILRLRVWIF